MNLSSLRKKLAEAAPVAQPQQKPQSQQQVMPDRRLVRKAGVDYNKLVQAMRRLQRNPNPKLLPADLAQNYGKYMDASVNAATMAARSGGGRYFAESAQADPPMMLVLKRKGVRVFPDGKRVALYINEKLGLSFSVPYNSNGPEQQLVGVSEAMDFVYENLNDTNKALFEELLESPDGFERAASFCLDIIDQLDSENGEE